MGIGSIGFSELTVIFIIVLVFFGPRRFPEIARSMGHAMREFRRSLNQIQREIEDADPRSSIPGRDLLSDIRAGRTGKWLDPDQAGEARKAARPDARATSGPLTASRGEPQSTGEAAGVEPDGGEQLPMFDGESPPPPASAGDAGASPEEAAEADRSRDTRSD